MWQSVIYYIYRVFHLDFTIYNFKCWRHKHYPIAFKLLDIVLYVITKGFTTLVHENRIKMKELRMIMFTWVNFSRAPFCGVLKQPIWSRNGHSEAVFATISFKVIFCLNLWQLLTTKIWNFVDIFTRDDFMLVFVIVGGF